MKKISVLTFFIFLFSLQTYSYAAHNNLQDKYCTICHKSLPEKPEFSSPGGLKFNINKACLNCHFKYESNHKLNVKPGINAGQLPLNSKGKIDCNTCHDVHNKSGFAMLLRISPEKLCAECHKK